MDHPLYGATLYLNLGNLHPLIRDHEDATIGQLRGCFLDVLGRIVEDEETRSKIDAQSLDYEALRGDAFSNKLAKQNLETKSPRKFYLHIHKKFQQVHFIPNCYVFIWQYS